jgi:hypothetical protein
MAFYITYVVGYMQFEHVLTVSQVFNIPGNLLLTVISPDKAIALGALVWGVAATAQAGAQNFASVVVCRLFIGLGELGQTVRPVDRVQASRPLAQPSGSITASGIPGTRSQSASRSTSVWDPWPGRKS